MEPSDLPPPEWAPPTPVGASGVDPATSVPPGRSRWPLVAVSIVTVGALAVVGAALLGGDDVGQTIAVSSTESDGGSSVTDTEPAETFVLTTPTSTDAVSTSSTAPIDSSPDVQGTFRVDDLGAFGLIVPDTLEADGSPVELGGLTFARISAAVDLAAYQDDDETIGFTALATLADEAGWTPEEFLAELAVGSGACTEFATTSFTSASLGEVVVDLVDGCGFAGRSSKVAIAGVTSDGWLVCLFVQGPGPAEAALLGVAKDLLDTFETIETQS